MRRLLITPEEYTTELVRKNIGTTKVMVDIFPCGMAGIAFVACFSDEPATHWYVTTPLASTKLRDVRETEDRRTTNA